ncbi:MAG: LysR family transcriptional regulator [Proteobacteria bacterium]|nr:LysR family transcriptional regulator [Pseudomonadota bacterium]
MYRLPPLVEIRAFEAAARHLSFKKAAAELGVTPTAISHQIRLLELHCGCSLFRRRPRPLALTEEGARLLPIFRDGLAAFADAIQSVRRTVDTQPLRITTTNAFASRWLVPRLPAWRRLRPDAPLDVIGTDGVIDLQSGEADIAIRYAREAPVDGISELLLADRFFPVCSPALAHAGMTSAAALERKVLVHSYWSPSDDKAPTWKRWLSAAAERERRNVPELSAMDHLSFREELHAIEAVISGQGIGLFSDVLVAAELASGALVKALDLSLPGYRFYIVHKVGHPRERLIRAFTDWLQSAK